MNLEKLFETQKALDDRIIEKHGLQDMDRLPYLILALQVELGECANEWRGFKFWSEDREPRTLRVQMPSHAGIPSIMDAETTNPLLEEYVDCLHFFLSIALNQKWERAMYLHEEQIIETETDTKDTIGAFIELNNALSNAFMNRESDGEFAGFTKPEYLLRIARGIFITIGLNCFGFDLNDVEQAYFEKNNTNHERQANGY